MSLDKVPSHDDTFDVSVNPSRKREFFSFLKNIRAFKGDLSSFTAPPFLLSPVSLTEHPTSWAEVPDLFVAPATESNPERRTLLVLKWYIGSLMQHFGKRQDKRKKKPLNPFLGELFIGRFNDKASGTTEVVIEQVSHHPPVTAYKIWNQEHGVTLEGYHAQKTYFSGTVHMERVGHVLMHLDKWNEDFVITQPKMHLEGLIPPPPYPEMDGITKIVSSSGFTVDIEYSGKGWLRGKKNSFLARMHKTGQPETILYTAEGQWQWGSWAIKDARGKVLDTFDTSRYRELAVFEVAPIEEQDPLESRRAWFQVAQGIEKGDMSTVHREKSKIEEEQRAMRKAEKIEDREWEARYFNKAENWPETESLLRKAGIEIENESTKGIWRWDENKYEKVKSKKGLQ